MLKETIDTDADELEVVDVRCSVTGVPISVIPHWYAKVKVKFVSEHGRGKAAPATLAVVEEAEEEEEGEEPTEVSLEDVDENIAGDDFDLGGVEISDSDED